MKTYHVFHVRAEHLGNLNVRLRDIHEGRNLKASNYTFVCSCESENLDTLFREMNVVEGNELPVKLKCRSMMVGDVVLDIADGQGWVCDMIGWKPLDNDIVQAFVFAVPDARS